MFASILTSAAAATTNATLRAPLDKPNFIMMFVDDLGYGDVGFTGHPTTATPTIDKLAFSGKVLTTWYSACPVCSASRASIMTGRQWTRFGIPGVLGPTTASGLPLNETTIASELKQSGYATGVVGKWHLGQREAYLPASRGFDAYLGVPYSVDMGAARASPCGSPSATTAGISAATSALESLLQPYIESGFSQPLTAPEASDPAGDFLPLVSQRRSQADGRVHTTVVESQPLDFTSLSTKYTAFVNGFIDEHSTSPFFLYMPFSHVHTTRANQPERQYCGCDAKNATRRGPFGDALAEVDDLIAATMSRVEKHSLARNTLVLFTGDNGPWMVQGNSGGSPGLLSGRYSGYWNVGKGSTWEGGIREAAFAYWPGMIQPFTRSAEVVSSMDVFPTLLALAGGTLPSDRTYDGRDARSVLLDVGGKSKHTVLFFYGSSVYNQTSDPMVALPNAARYGPYKAHWVTAAGLSGCKPGHAAPIGCPTVHYTNGPLIFNVEEDPAESIALCANTTTPSDPELARVVNVLQSAYAKEIAGKIVRPSPPAPDGPGEGPGTYGICCNRTKGCDCDGKPSPPR